MLKLIRGSKIWKFGENSCGCNNWRLPGEPRSIDNYSLSDRLFNNKRTYWILPAIWISQMAKVCTFSHWRSSNLGEWKPIFSSLDNSVEAERWVSLLILSLGSGQLGHHRIVACGKQEYSFVPHSPAILALLCFWIFVLFIWVLLHAFLSEFQFRLLYPIVSFCVSGVFHVSAHGRRGTLAI